ncbi:drug/metabolite transporter (DMT)-like permease [Phycicoccus badiiscoriae]|uniref:Drug/metabolite transporter (DMT)-like permease n=1 Tax=Pedococcus badiiscoriae TaxID=642776 RepID=A0A852WM15_9MICO|nr:hypothetical protein [Pedococcus badiiscoriae]NYG08631.1 drug/metabolite transporter (DMT)-like permease [Pedococcus badiiscoriae]
MTLAFVAALVGTFGYGIASVLQAVGTARANGLAVLRQPTYVLGLGCDAVAWVASLLALRQLPLFAVQALLAGSLAVTVVLARVVLGTRMRPRDAVAAGVVTGTLVVLAASAGPPSTLRTPGSFVPIMLVVLALIAVATAAAWARPRSGALAVIAGVAFSGAALSARAVQGAPATEGVGSTHGAVDWVALLHEPLAWAVIGYGALGMLCYTLALEHGPVGPATAILWVVEVALPAVVGVVVLGDGVRAGWALPAVVSLVLALAACVVLATGPGQEPGQTPAKGAEDTIRA